MCICHFVLLHSKPAVGIVQQCIRAFCFESSPSAGASSMINSVKYDRVSGLISTCSASLLLHRPLLCRQQIHSSESSCCQSIGCLTLRLVHRRILMQTFYSYPLQRQRSLRSPWRNISACAASSIPVMWGGVNFWVHWMRASNRVNPDVLVA